jgi:hypothetical protein
MKLLPYHKFRIVTSLKPAEVEERLHAEISPPVWGFDAMFADPTNTYFRGVIANGNFKVMRIIRNRNSFLPVVIGHIESSNNGSRVFVKLRLHLLVAVFMSIWLGGIAVACIVMLAQSIIKGFTPSIFMPFGMFAFGYAMMIGFYNAERKKATAILLQLLDGQIDQI